MSLKYLCPLHSPALPSLAPLSLCSSSFQPPLLPLPNLLFFPSSTFSSSLLFPTPPLPYPSSSLRLLFPTNPLPCPSSSLPLLFPTPPVPYPSSSLPLFTASYLLHFSVAYPSCALPYSPASYLSVTLFLHFFQF